MQAQPAIARCLAADLEVWAAHRELDAGRGRGQQSNVVALLVERVDIGTDGLNVRLRVDGLGSLAREMLAGGIEAAA